MNPSPSQITQPMTMNLQFLAAACLFLGLLTGCQNSVSTDYHKIDIASVSGKVKLDGSPLSGAYIIFQADDETYSFGKTDSNGNYKLMLNTEKSGIVPGKKTVKIRLARAFGSEGAFLDGGNAGSGADEGVSEGSELPSKKSFQGKELPSSYHKESKLSAIVKSGSQSFNFDLKSDGSTTGPE